jgi:pyruvate dehydrogenase (quinone)
MPLSPLGSPDAVVWLVVYSARAILHGKRYDVWEMVVQSIG